MLKSKIRSVLRIRYAILISFLILINCHSTPYTIPYVDVYIIISLGDPEYNALNAIGNSANVTGGYKGIMIYRKSMDEFLAFERACPYDPNCTCTKTKCGLVTTDKAGITATDNECCGSQYSLILDGNVVKGPGKLPLKQYQVNFNPNTNILTITN
jgi:hypothetical protein